jgi:hypothetical protein
MAHGGRRCYSTRPTAVPHSARCIVLQIFFGPYIFAKKKKEKCKKEKKSGSFFSTSFPMFEISATNQSQSLDQRPNNQST